MTAADTVPARITVRPTAVLIERTANGQELNFDFLVENTSRDTVVIESIEVSVYGAGRQLVLRRFLDDNGSSPSIETVPRRAIAPLQSTLVFNPFHTFPNDTDLGELRYTFRVKHGDRHTDVIANVKPQRFEPKTKLQLPLRGRFIVYDAHDHYAHHRRLNYADQMGQRLGINANFMRYAYDFIAVDSAGEMSHGDVAQNKSWLAFGNPVFAPGAGRIVQLNDRAADDRKIDMAAVMNDPVALYGNYIVIDHLNGEFSMLGHIQQGSARVKLGDTVVSGQHVANVGASGSSLMPHLHYELRTGVGVRGVEGLPSYFDGHGSPATGDIIDARPATAAGESRVELLTAALDIMAKARFANFTTIGRDDHPQTRIVDPFIPENDFTIWIGTNALTRKVSEVKADSRVSLLYFNAAAGEYVTVIGTATFIDDAGEKARHWKSEWAEFYKGGSSDVGYVLIRVRPVRLEIVSPGRGIMNDPATWRPVTVDFP